MYVFIVCLLLMISKDLERSFATFAAGKVHGTAIHPQPSPKQTRLQDGGSEPNNTENQIHFHECHDFYTTGI